MNQQEKEVAIQQILDLSDGDTDPSEEQLRNLLSGDLEGPFHFVNLLAFKATELILGS